MTTKLPTKGEIVEGLATLGLVVFMLGVPFFIGIQVCRYLRWGCG